MGYTVPPMPLIQLPTGDGEPPVFPSMQQAKDVPIFTCDYCGTRRADILGGCPNCGAHQAHLAERPRRKLVTREYALPAPLVMTERR